MEYTGAHGNDLTTDAIGGIAGGVSACLAAGHDVTHIVDAMHVVDNRAPQAGSQSCVF
jgi:hypothetical protein